MMSEYTKTYINLRWRWKKWKKGGRGQVMSEYTKTNKNLRWRWKKWNKSNSWTETLIWPIMTTFTFAIHRWKAIDLRLNLAPSYQDLKHPTSCQNYYDTYYDTPGQIPKLILTLRHVLPNIPQWIQFGIFNKSRNATFSSSIHCTFDAANPPTMMKLIISYYILGPW